MADGGGLFDGFNWGNLIQPLVTSGFTYLTSRGQAEQERKRIEQQQQFTASQAQLDRDLRLQLANMAGGGGGGGGSGDALAIAKMQQVGNAYDGLREAYFKGGELNANSLQNFLLALQRTYNMNKGA